MKNHFVDVLPLKHYLFIIYLFHELEEIRLKACIQAYLNRKQKQVP